MAEWAKINNLQQEDMCFCTLLVIVEKIESDKYLALEQVILKANQVVPFSGHSFPPICEFENTTVNYSYNLSANTTGEGKFCSHNKWAGTDRTCKERVKFLLDKYKVPEEDAIRDILEHPEQNCQCGKRIIYLPLQCSESETTENKENSNLLLPSLLLPPEMNRTQYEFRKRSCENSCYKYLEPEIKSKPAWFFLGDSQMGFLTTHLVKNFHPYRHENTARTASGRCGFLSFCGKEKASEWKPPDPLGRNQTQGPTRFGLQHHFCSDLFGHGNAIWESTRNNSHFMQYMTVEFASDVEQQTNVTNTTQETAVMHMIETIQKHKLTTKDSVCVVNVGLHDQKLCPGKSEEFCTFVFVENVKRYFELLDTACGKIVWISISSVLGIRNIYSPQRNERTIIWNQLVQEHLLAKYSPKAFIFDVWNYSETSNHRDNVHFQPEYYKAIAHVFASLM